MEGVSLVDAFVFAHADAGRQIDLNLDGSGAGHGLLHEYFGADILWAGTQLTANLSRNGFSPSAAPKNTRTVNVDPWNDVQSMGVDNAGYVYVLSSVNHGVWRYNFFNQ